MKECVITSAVRTPVGGYMGSLKSIPPEELAVPILQEALKRSGLEAEHVDQVILGDVLSKEPNIARISALLAGFPIETPAYTVDRQCGSSLQAVISAAQAIKAGDERVIIAGGTESMSRGPYFMTDTIRFQGLRSGDSVLTDSFQYATTHSHPYKLYKGLNMGLTAENIAQKYCITRDMQDEFACDSQRKYKEAFEAGKFKDEILPITVQERKKQFVFDADEHPRSNTTLESLGKMKPAFLFDGSGTVTAGNSSGMNDGASAVVVMCSERARQIGCNPRARIVATASAGVDPALMGMGPVPAVQKVLKRTGLSLEDIGLFEFNEAFAAQSLGCLIELGMEPGSRLYERVNVNGGAIAHGHALANSGTRLLTTMMYEMERRSAQYGLATLCCGGGQGVAVLLENC